MNVKAAGALGWQIYNFRFPIVFNSKSMKPSGALRVCTGNALLYLSFVQLILPHVESNAQSFVICSSKPSGTLINHFIF